MFSCILMERKGKARDQHFFQLEGQIGGVAPDATRSLLGVVEGIHRAGKHSMPESKAHDLLSLQTCKVSAI